MMSDLYDLGSGKTIKPSFLNTAATKSAPFKDSCTICGAKNNPCRINLPKPKLIPASAPIPGAVNLQHAISTNSESPAIYPPVGTIVPPKFLISDPAIIFAPLIIGSLSSTSSP